MTLDAPGKIEVRTSLHKVVAGLVGFVLLACGLSFCTPSYGQPSTGAANPGLIPAIALVSSLFILARTLTQRSPRIILDATGILWREDGEKIYEALPWPEIFSASIEPGGEDEVKRLRLHLAPRPALERVASEGARRWVDISIDTVDIHERRLRRVINQWAPHLFTGAARDRLDLTAT